MDLWGNATARLSFTVDLPRRSSFYCFFCCGSPRESKNLISFGGGSPGYPTVTILGIYFCPVEDNMIMLL
jgi:hypothetical protein